MKRCFTALLFFYSICIPAMANAAGDSQADNLAMFKVGYINPSIMISNPNGDNIYIDPGTYYELSYTRRFGVFGVRGALGYAQNSCDKSVEYENGSQKFYKANLYSVNAPVTFMYIYSSKIMDFYAGVGPGLYYRKIKIDYSNRSYADSVKSTSFNIGSQGLIGVDLRVVRNLAIGVDLEYNIFAVKFDDDYSDTGTVGEFTPSFSISYSF